MLLRDAQEQARILFAARRDSSGRKGIPLEALAREAADTLTRFAGRKPSDWKDLVEKKDRLVGLMLLAVLGAANVLEVDSLEAFKAVLDDESP